MLESMPGPAMTLGNWHRLSYSPFQRERMQKDVFREPLQ